MEPLERIVSMVANSEALSEIQQETKVWKIQSTNALPESYRVEKCA